MAIPIIDGILGIASTVGGIFSNWQKRKLVESEGKIRIEEARVDGEIRRNQAIADGTIEYDVTAQQGMRESWKDELLTIVLCSVFVACFIPWTQPYLREGFIFLKENTPWWFEWSFTGMIAASFGLRGWKLIRGNQ